VILFASAELWADGPPKRVLLLDSFGRNVAPISTIISVFRTELSLRLSQPIDLHEVSLEMARFAQPEQELPFVNFLRERFSIHRPDLVVAVGSPAFTFMQRHRDLFPATPVLITAVAEQVLQSGAIIANTAVFPVTVDLTGIVEDILNVLPGTTNIEVVLGSSPNEIFWLNECRRSFSAFSGRIKFTYLNHLSFEDLRGHVAQLPPNSAVFFGMLLLDGDGIPYDSGEALRILCESANSPIFSVNESYLGLGVVGGRLIPERAVGAQTVEVALRMLNGESAGTIKLSSRLSNVPVYDWRALMRWGISERRLPPGSTILFRQPSLWELYGWYIAGGLILLIFQAFLIARLLVQKRRREHAEHELVRSEQRLRLITNALPVLIAYVDSEQRYRFNNDAYKAWFGVSAEGAAGRTIREVVGERIYRRVIPYVEKALAGKQVRYALEVELEEGRTVSIEAIYVPDVDEEGAVCGFYALAMDVTDRNFAQKESKRLQDELLHAGRISTMGELSGALAHEINQPLSAIMSNAQAASRYLSAPSPDMDEVREILQDIVKEDARAGEVINRLRALLKKTKTDFEPLDLNSVFREVIGLLHGDAVIRGVMVSSELDPSLPLVIGDRIQLQQVALNLMLNAFEAMNQPANGERRVLIRTGRKDDQVVAAVTDNGNGIPVGDTERIFKPFYTSKPQGLGMGLSICRSIINSHHGRLWVENNPDGGATFWFSLPIPAEESISKQE
jgi:PAS domain S-box-containing protein